MITIHLLPVLYGDTILINSETNGSSQTNILIDCGYNYRNALLPLLQKIKNEGQHLDRFIITHYDDDHIRNAGRFIKDNGMANLPKIIGVNQVWLNTFRHIQFDKKNDVNNDQKSEQKLKDFISIQANSQNLEDTEVGALGAVKLGKELLIGGYSWNSDFGEKAVCFENASEPFNINDQVSIQILGPTKDQLQKLEGAFIEALKSLSISVSSSEIIDDAFELFLLKESRETSIADEGELSGHSGSSLNIDSISDICKKHNYQPDKAPGNGSSITFIYRAEGKEILMLADSHAEPIIDKLKFVYPDKEIIIFDAIKVPHHGSFGNNPKQLYDLVDSSIFLFSTNGNHPSHVHPDVETIAFIINRPLPSKIKHRTLVFNYRPAHLPDLFNPEMMEHYHYTVKITQEITI